MRSARASARRVDVETFVASRNAAATMGLGSGRPRSLVKRLGIVGRTVSAASGVHERAIQFQIPGASGHVAWAVHIHAGRRRLTECATGTVWPTNLRHDRAADSGAIL